MRNGKVGKAGAMLLASLLVSIVEPALSAERTQLDKARNRAWTLTRDGIQFQDLGTNKKIAVPLREWIWAHEPYGCLPDLALGPKGEAVVTSNVVSTLWRIDPDTLAVSIHPLALDADTDKDVGFSAIAYSSRHGAYYAMSQIQGSIWKIDPLLRRAQKAPLAAHAVKTCGPAVRPPAAFLSLPND